MMFLFIHLRIYEHHFFFFYFLIVIFLFAALLTGFKERGKGNWKCDGKC